MICSYINNEFYKVNLRLIIIIILLFVLLPFLVTLSILFTKQDLLVQGVISFELVNQNTIGAWSSLLYPLLCMVIVQTITMPEHETNSLKYYKSTNISWISFYISKCVFVWIFVFLSTSLNIILNIFITIYIRQYFSNDIADIILDLVKTFVLMNLYCIPIIFFQMYISLMIKQSYLSFAIGLILLVVGIPISNLTNFIYNPYTVIISCQKLGYFNAEIILFYFSLIVLKITIFKFNLYKIKS